MGALAKGQKLGHVFTVLSLTQQAGIPFYRAWRVPRRPLKVSTGREYCAACGRTLKRPSRLVILSKSGNLYPALCSALRTGEISGALDIMLAKLARHHTEQTFQRAENLAALLEPVLLIVTGVIIGTLVVAMYLPIFHREMR